MPSDSGARDFPGTRYQASFYNLRVDLGGENLVFNGASSALLRLPVDIAPALLPLLGPERPRQAGIGFSAWDPPSFSEEDLDPQVRQLMPTLLEAGVFVETGVAERDEIKQAYEIGRSRAPLFVTLTTTLDCNMRCYYCYQKDGKLEGMSIATCDEIATWVKARIAERDHRRVYIDWYGGEPMLNQAVIERFSADLIAFCDSGDVGYKASMICNGTNWPADPIEFVRRNRIESIQFSIDGPKRHHDKRRGVISGDGKPGRAPSFDRVMDTINALIGHTKIYLRVNVDPWTAADCLELVDYCAGRGWLEEDTRFYPYVALINAMTEHCGFIAKSNKFNDFETEFDRIQQRFYSLLSRYRDQRSLEVVQYFPNRVTINCAAVSHNAVVFGPNGLAYKCGLDVGDNHRAHAGIGVEGQRAMEERGEALSADRWDKYDPFTHPRCSECQYLPVCMGGCPKAQIEGDAAQIAQQSRYWESNIDRIIRDYYLSATGAA